jgi:hypothetical protein
MNRVCAIFILKVFISIYATNIYGENNDFTTKSGTIISYFQSMNRATTWQFVNAVKQNFRTYHPQGMVKIGEYFFLSSVEQIIKTEKLNPPQNGYDRTAGTGVGHLFKIDPQGNLVAKINLGEGSIYHPGGIDYDGEYLWIPVSEYRPNSRSIIYRVTPINLEVKKMFYTNDHIGGIVHNRYNHLLHGVSWGSRRFYTWKLDQLSEFENYTDEPEFETQLNGNHYIDYQDCHLIGRQYMLCGGLSKSIIETVGIVAFGGLALVDLDKKHAVHQIPVNIRLKPDLVMTQNPFCFEMVNNRLRFYFMPEDDESSLYIYDAINHD